MYFFTGDEHMGHRNILKYTNGPFSSIEERDNEIIKRHNKIVRGNDSVIHMGDYTLSRDKDKIENYLIRLNGKHLFLEGSHDRWIKDGHLLYLWLKYLPKDKILCRLPIQIWEKKIDNQWVVACHYNMRVWARSHYNSWLVFGHSHGTLSTVGKQHDVGVDNNNFYPVSFAKLKEIMETKPDNFNLIRK